MGLNTCTGYQAKCDTCGKVRDDGDFAFWLDPQYAIEEAIEADWTQTSETGETKLACTDCPPFECRECDTPITDENPWCDSEGKNQWSCANCHSDCDHKTQESTP